MRKLILLFVLSSFAFSCSSSRKTSSRTHNRKPKTERVVIESKPTTRDFNNPDKGIVVVEDIPVRVPTSTDEYVTLFSAIAQEEMRLYHIPASITLAQGILESASGKGRLSVEANNHFGIKCHEWTGARIYHDDDASQECFRKYNDAKYSYRDHSLFLVNRARYKGLFNLRIDDYKGWARGLKAAGYATDSRYPDKLISLIERYELYKYDHAVTGVTSGSVPMPKQAITENTHLISKGDTLYSLSKKYNTSVDEIKRLNNLSTNNLTVGNVLVVKLN